MGTKHIYEQLIEALGYDSVRKFAKEIKVPSSTITAAITRNSGVSISIADKIVKRFKHVNRDSLLTGKGELLKSDPHTLNDGDTPYKPNLLKRVRTLWNSYLAKLAIDADGEELKKNLRELNDAIRRLEEQNNLTADDETEGV